MAQLTNDRIRELALINGFPLRTQPDGVEDLDPCVYNFAKALAREIRRERTSTDVPKYLTIVEVCDMLKISRKTLERYRAAGDFPKPDLMLRTNPRWLLESIRNHFNYMED